MLRVRNFVSDESGVTAIEYALIAALIAVAIIGAVTTVAFEETGRGMLISLGLTSLVQGTLTTVGYLIIGVRRVRRDAWRRGRIWSRLVRLAIEGLRLSREERLHDR